MNRLLPSVLVSCWIVAVSGSSSWAQTAQNFAPPAAKSPDDAVLKEINAKTEKLAKLIFELRKQGVRDPQLAEVEIYHKAAVWIVRHGEWYPKDIVDWTQAVLDRGLLRASQAAAGDAPWLSQFGFDVVRAYRSGIDGSVQPYAVTFPADYGKDARKKWRIDIVLHGRDSTITEVKFLYQHQGSKPAPKEQDFIRIDIFGRTNNAYRWAGETDVFEALTAFQTVETMLGREALLDLRRVVLRGFSMGGAGTWHIGLHYPDRWCVMQPGAGFTTTHGYIPSLPDKLPDYQEKCLRIYDAVDYAENAANIPVVAYSGSEDAQMAAARNIETRLKTLGIPMKHVIAPGLGHQFPPEWQKKVFDAYAPFLAKGKDDYPQKVRLVTYTLRYPSCNWVEILGLNRHYEQAKVEADKTDDGFAIKTSNVRSLRLVLIEAEADTERVVKIDGQELKIAPYRSAANTLTISLERRGDTWHAVLPQKLIVDRLRRPQKVSGMQGPIDDAFVSSFVCVRGTGKPWHEATGKYAEANLRRFQGEWDKFLRGDLPVKDDKDVTEEDIAGKNLILFGDPASNSLLAEVIDKLPLKWTKDAIALNGKTYAAGEHQPVMIFPSPLNTTRYVVLNSGHTFHAPEFRGTNAQLYPRLGDFAILKLAGTDKDPLAVETAAAGLFDDFWQMAKE